MLSIYIVIMEIRQLTWVPGYPTPPLWLSQRVDSTGGSGGPPSQPPFKSAILPVNSGVVD